MKIPFTDLQSEYQECKWEIDEAIKYCLENNSFITGPDVAEFEQIFSDYTGGESCAACGSGTTALQISLKACGIGRGDEVITVSHTFVSTPEAVCTVGATPVFCDVNKHGLIDINRAESLITNKTKAILWVDLYGQTPDIDKLVTLCKKHNLYSIADSAQAFGYKYKGRRVGSLADITCHSFNPVKNLGAIGDAGLITTNSKKISNILNSLKNYGSIKKYHNNYIGFNNRMDEIQAAFLLEKLKDLNSINKKKILIAKIYDKYLSSKFIKPKIDNFNNVFHIYPIRVKKRNKFIKYLNKINIPFNIHYPIPPHKQKALSSFFKNKKFPITEEIHKTTISLPIATYYSKKQIEKFCIKINKFYD